METKRVISLGAEKWLGVEQKVLDDGLVELVDYMGTDEQMVGIARISHGKILPHTEPEAAQRLINYFTENKHTSPFEFIEVTFRWRLPIFVARQVIRHRTANVNEKSARYAELDAKMYVPEVDRVLGQDTKNRQGSSGALPPDIRQDFVDALKIIEESGKFTYKSFLEDGVAKELARIHLPVGVYTDWVWKMDLHNLFHFLGLRLDSHAQYEVRVYAEAMYRVLKDAFPMCCQAFEEYKLYAKTFSRSEISILRGIVQDHLDRTKLGVSQKLLDKLTLALPPGDASEQKSSTNPTTSN